MSEPGKDETDRVQAPLKTLIVVLAGFCVVIWVAVEPWSTFVRRSVEPIVPSPEPTPSPSTHSSPVPLSPETDVGSPVPEGRIAIRGRAVDSHEKVVAGALVTVRLLERTTPRPLEGLDTEAKALAQKHRTLAWEERAALWRELVWGKTTAELGSALSRDDGRFEVLGAFPAGGTIAVEVRSPAGGPLRAVTSEIHASPADAREGALGLGRVVLQPLVPLAVLCTDATQARGFPGARVELRIGKSELLPLVAVTDAQGICDLLAPPGEHELAASLEGVGQNAAVIRLGTTAQNLALVLDAPGSH